MTGETVSEIPTEEKKRLEDALDAIQKIDPNIQPGPYVSVENSDITDNGDSTVIKVKIPKELQKEGRTFYLIRVDADGNVIVLQNESLEDGIFSAVGEAGVTYQIVYEDGGSVLADMLSEDGKLTDADGKAITVSTNHCFWHWLMLLVTLLGMAAGMLLGSRKKKYVWVAFAGTAVLVILFAVLGFCKLDGLFAIVCMICMLLAGLLHHKKNRGMEKSI